MERKIRGVYTMAILVFSIFLVASAFQIRPMNQMKHPGIANPYVPPTEGPNHSGPSDYTNKWLGISEICELGDNLARPGRGNWFVRAFLCSD